MSELEVTIPLATPPCERPWNELGLLLRELRFLHTCTTDAEVLEHLHPDHVQWFEARIGYVPGLDRHRRVLIFREVDDAVFYRLAL